MLTNIINTVGLSGVSIDADHFLAAYHGCEVCLEWDGVRYHCELYRSGEARPFNYIRTPYERDVVRFLREDENYV